MSPSVEHASIGVDPVAGLRSCRATADILLIHDHRALGDSTKRWTVSSVVLGVGRRIARISGRSLGVDSSTRHRTMHVRGVLAALKVLVILTTVLLTSLARFAADLS